MNEKKIESLLQHYLKGTCTEQEKELVESWLDQRALQNSWSWKDENDKERVQDKMMGKIMNRTQSIPLVTKRRPIPYFRLMAAIVVFATLTFGTWFLLDKHQPVILPTKDTQLTSLQLGNGEIIYLDDAEPGVLSARNDVSILKTEDGKIAYEVLEKKGMQKLVALENTLSIPRGKQYQVRLPDGTIAWLNSETSLQYPVRFDANERRVKLKGEAYFEVAKQANQPFIVESEGMDILVTGTQFNVSAYQNAGMQSTTLIEGSVNVVSKMNEHMSLIPGQQAYKKNGSKTIEKRDVNVDHIISWKKGYFSFDNQTLEETMEQISRWYDIEYEIIGQPENVKKLGGTFSRKKTLDELLLYLEQLLAVKITTKGRSVIINY